MNLLFITLTAITATYGLFYGFNGLTLLLWIITALTGTWAHKVNYR